MKKIKFYLIAVIMLLCSGVNAQEGTVGIPISEFGYTGEIIGISSHNFTTNGNLEVTATDVLGFSMYLTDKTKSGYKAVGSGYNYDITVSKGKITKITFKGSSSTDWKGSLSFTYSKDKIVINMSQSRTYVEEYYVDYSSKIKELERKLNNLASSMYSMSYTQYLKKCQEYNALISKYYNMGYEVKTRKKTDTDKLTATLYNFKKDRFGNVVSFDIKSNKTEGVRTVAINIVYNQDWYGQSVFEAAKTIEDFKALYYDVASSEKYRLQALNKYNELCLAAATTIEDFESLYNDVLSSEKNKLQGMKKYNDAILETLEKDYVNDTEAILKVMSKSILSKENYNKLSQIISERFYGDALTIKDYKAAAEEAYSTFSVNGVKIAKYNSEFQGKILEYSAQLRSDSLQNLRTRAQNLINEGKYERAIRVTDNVLKIEPDDEVGIDLSQESHFKLIQKNLDDGQNVIQQIEYVQSLYPESKYKNELEDMRSRYYLKTLSAEAETKEMLSMSDVELLKSLEPHDKKLAKDVKKLARKQEFKNKRGDVWNFGIGVNGEVGSGMYGVFGEVGIRVGYLKNWVNAYVGVRYGVMGSTKGIMEKTGNTTSGSTAASATDGKLELSRLAVPVVLRLNLYSTYTSAFYLGLGAELNLNFSTKVKTSDEKYSDNKMANTMTYSPRVSLGYNAGGLFDLEVFGLYDLKNTFNTDYMISEGYADFMDPEIYKAQTENKMRFGASLRIFF